MPRIARNPDIPVFEFELNPEKELSESTLKIYKANLNKITAASYEQSQQDKRKKPLVKKADLLKNPSRLIAIINSIGKENRATKCALYSAVFYVVGKKNLKRNKKYNLIVDAFREVYNDDKYKEYKAKKAEEEAIADEADGQLD